MKLYIETLGCPKNFNDSEGIAGIWERAGMQVTDDPAAADAILVNTCGFINDAKKESIDKIFEMARFIEDAAGETMGRASDKPVGEMEDTAGAADGTPSRASASENGGASVAAADLAGTDSAELAAASAHETASAGSGAGMAAKKLLVVSGCLSQRYGKELFDEMPEVDIFLGVNDYERLPQIVSQFQRGKREKIFSCHPDRFEEFSARKTAANPYSATLRIAEGCDNCCAYCAIPQIRGGYRSRPMEHILQEAEELSAKGCKELILIAQDVTEYGRDLYGRLRLPDLLRALCKINGIRWIRLMYCYEDKITDELIEVMAAEEKICPYIDIPLQHISDGVLRRMNRCSTKASITDTLVRLRSAILGIHIRTTLIAGFPGESEAEFEELLDFVESAKFERLGVFAYSREEGTSAGGMAHQIDEDEKIARVDAVMRRQIDISRAINEAKVGNLLEVLVDGMDEAGAYIGRTACDAPEIDNTVIFSADRELLPGDMVKVRIEDAFDYDLAGRMEE